jgi:excisionase family DNA binding protein
VKANNAEDMMTVVEVATYLKVSKSTVWNWCRAGKIPAFKLAHEWRVRRKDLDRAIDEGLAGGIERRP